MVRWAIIFLVIAALAALFGFGGTASAAAAFAKLLFVAFFVLGTVTLLRGLGRRGVVK